MHANELWRLLAEESLADIPVNNLVPLLQNLGKLGVKVSDIAPFLRSEEAQKRLCHFIHGGGFELTDDERMATEILGSQYILYAGAVLNVLGLTHMVSEANRKIAIPPELLEKAAKENSEGRSVFQDCWRLVYCAPQSLNHLTQISFRHGVNFMMNRWGNCKMNESTLFPPEVKWAHKVPEEGYYLVNYSPLSRSEHASEVMWSEQEKAIRHFGGKGAHRMGAAQYAQSLIVHFALKHLLPWPVRMNCPQHWAVEEPALKIYIEAKGSEQYNDYGHVTVSAGEGIGGPSCTYLNIPVQGVYCYGPNYPY